mmetsp:Transcript_36462/g.97603  ORF Transcript_36462/g.97603 Transcript_36462/m.97603 type:complete len:243 (+) Transcript_36462:326-1054(+)
MQRVLQGSLKLGGTQKRRRNRAPLAEPLLQVASVAGAVVLHRPAAEERGRRWARGTTRQRQVDEAPHPGARLRVCRRHPLVGALAHPPPRQRHALAAAPRRRPPRYRASEPADTVPPLVSRRAAQTHDGARALTDLVVVGTKASGIVAGGRQPPQRETRGPGTLQHEAHDGLLEQADGVLVELQCRVALAVSAREHREAPLRAWARHQARRGRGALDGPDGVREIAQRYGGPELPPIQRHPV